MSDAKQDDLLFGASDRIELIATIVMALAAILTAWSAFQAGKWSGNQAIEFSNANSARVESTRADGLANSQRSIDVGVFTSWLDAVGAEVDSGEIPPPRTDGYEPVDGTLSAFYFERMRPEFKVALDAWLESDPLNDANAPPTPFAMDEYVIQAAVDADALLETAAEHRELALEANQNGDNYVLTTVGFALVIFFAGISSKLAVKRNRWIAIVLAMVLFVGASITLFSLPIVSPFG